MLNAIGGRAKVPGILCMDCNSKSGSEWDAELAQQLNPLSLLFGIKRDRGAVPPQDFPTRDGDTLTLYPDGKLTPAFPAYEENHLGADVHIRMVARSMREAREMLKGVRRKYPQVDLKELLSSAEVVSSYPKSPIQFSLSFGGPLTGRSIVKSALSLAIAHGVDAETCNNALAYLAQEDGEPCFDYWYARDLVLDRPQDRVFHCVAIDGSAEKGLLVGYVEFFAVQRMVVCLSDDYPGPNVSTSYSIDPVTGEELDLTIDLSISQDELIVAERDEKRTFEAVEEALIKVIPIALRDRFTKEKERVIAEAVEYAFKNCGAVEGEILTDEHVRAISRLVMGKLGPFLLHHMGTFPADDG